MTKQSAQYRDIAVEAEHNDGAISSIQIYFVKNNKPANNNAKLQKMIAGALHGDVAWDELDLSWATPFQLRVYRAMAKIKPGQTATYADLAKKIGMPRAYRAVANACARNRLPVVIPCHRVVRSDGGLGGYNAKDGLKMKKYLLQLEGYDIAN